MHPALLIRLRPTGPWRYGPGDGGQDRAGQDRLGIDRALQDRPENDRAGQGRVDILYRSDRLFSAVTLAMRQLGFLEDWLDATARASAPAVVFSSLFPYQGDTLFAPPPATNWPPPSSLLTAPSPVFLSKVRWSAAHFVPLGVIESILTGQPILGDQWMADAESGCLLRRDRPAVSPFRVAVRTAAAVDRVNHSAVQAHSSACIEFEPGSGLWCVARYSDATAESTWSDRVQACFRLLADTGFGGKRTSGWGQSEAPQFQQGPWPNLLFPKLARVSRNGNSNGASGDESPLYWLLSLYSPASADAIDWSGGDYRLTVRGGRIQSASLSGAKKKIMQMVAEGSVLRTRHEPVGAALNVASDNFPHAVYRSGFAVALELPVVGPADIHPVEIPSDEEALEARPCPEPAPPTLESEEPANEV